MTWNVGWYRNTDERQLGEPVLVEVTAVNAEAPSGFTHYQDGSRIALSRLTPTLSTLEFRGAQKPNFLVQRVVTGSVSSDLSSFSANRGTHAKAAVLLHFDEVPAAVDVKDGVK